MRPRPTYPPLLGVGAALGPASELAKRQRAALREAARVAGVDPGVAEQIVRVFLEEMRGTEARA